MRYLASKQEQRLSGCPYIDMDRDRTDIPPNNVLEPTKLSRLKLVSGSVIVMRSEQQHTLQTRLAAQHHRYAALDIADVIRRN